MPKTFPEGEASVSFAPLDESSGKALGVVTEGSTVHPWMSGATTGPDPSRLAMPTPSRRRRVRSPRGSGTAEASAREKAQLSWKNAVRHRPFRKDYRDAHDGAMRSAIAGYARRAEGVDDDSARAEALIAGLRGIMSTGGRPGASARGGHGVRGTRCGPLRISRRPIKPSRPASNSIRGLMGAAKGGGRARSPTQDHASGAQEEGQPRLISGTAGPR